MQIVEMLKPTEGEPCQWVGVYVTRWQQEWGEPSVMFRDVDTAAIASVPEVKALVDAARAVVQGASEIYNTGCKCGACTRRRELASALDAFTTPPAEVVRE